MFYLIVLHTLYPTKRTEWSGSALIQSYVVELRALTQNTIFRCGHVRNRVGIVVGQDLKNKTTNVRKIRVRILSTKLALENKIVHIIGMYAMLVGLDKEIKRQFSDSRDKLVGKIYHSSIKPSNSSIKPST